MNAESQQQSIAAKAQVDAQMEQIQAQNKISIVQTEMKFKQDIMTQEFVQSALMKSYELDKELPSEIQSIIDSYFSDIEQMKMQQQAAQEQAMQEQQMQEQEMQEGGQMPQAE